MLTPESRLRDFPSLQGRAYLNTAAEGIPSPLLKQGLDSYWTDKLQGMRGRDAHFARLEGARKKASRFIGLQPGEVAFCSCSSEAYNLLANALDLQAGDEVVISDLDFPAGATPWLLKQGVTTRVWSAREGALNPVDLPALLNDRTRLVQVSLVSFFNGHRIRWQPFRDAVRQHAPQALISVDVTQALGRVPLDCTDADVLISSTHKWILGPHGGCIVGIPERNAERVTTRAGGWFHLANAFEADRFQRAVPRIGAASFAVGMPNFAAIYALDEALGYLESVGVETINAHAYPLTRRLHQGLEELGLHPLAPWVDDNASGIVAFTHPDSERLHAACESAEVHVMHHAGRIRLAVHGYNTAADVDRALEVLRKAV